MKPPDLAERRFAGVPALGRVLDIVAAANEVLVVTAAAVDIIVTFASTVIRYAVSRDLPWAADASTVLIALITFLGAPAYFRRGTGMAYTAILDLATGSTRAAIRGCGLWISLFACLFSLILFPPFFVQQLGQDLPVLGISTAWSSIWLGVGLGLFVLFAAEKLAELGWRAAAASLALVGLLGLGLLFVRSLYLDDIIELTPFAVVIPVLLIAFATATPIALILALGGMLYVLLSGALPMVAIPATYQGGIGSYILLAIPFFMLAGTLMEVTGMAGRLIEMVQEWIGHWRGGLLVAQVVAMYIFSGISGSKAADVATVGTVMKRPLRQFGYPATESVAVLAASAAMGETVPPSLALLILGSVTSLSIGSLFVAGIVPAAVLAMVLIVTVLVRSQRRQWHKGPPFRLSRACRSVPYALPALMVPVIVIGGIVGGIASPTESSSFAVVYGFAAALLVYRSVGIRSGFGAVRDSALTAGMVLFMVATANLLSQVIVVDGLGRHLASLFSDLHNPTAFLFLSIPVIIVIGFVLEGFPAILIAAPILVPVATRVGVDPLQFGILLTMAVGIGVFMPPIGIGFYISCAVGEAPVNATMRPSALYNAILILGLCLVILVPQITLALPHFFGLN